MIGLMSIKDYARNCPTELVDCRATLQHGNLTVATLGGRALEKGDATSIKRSLKEAGYTKFGRTTFKRTNP